MRVAVKDQSGVFIHSITPRKARLLLKENKATIESKNPFTIRLLFSSSECGLKDFNHKSQDNTVFVLPKSNINNESIRENIMCIDVNKQESTEFDWESMRSHHFECLIQGYEEVSRLCCYSFLHKDKQLELLIIVIGETNTFITSLEKKLYTITIRNYYPDGRIFMSTTYKAIYDHKEENFSYDNKEVMRLRLIFKDAYEIISTNLLDNINNEKDTDNKDDRQLIRYFTKQHTHLIYGVYGCGKTSMVRDIINQRIKNNENTMLLTTSCAKQTYYRDVNSNVFRIFDNSYLKVTEENNTPELFAKYLVQEYIAQVGRIKVDTLIIDGYPFSTINPDYSEEEYFRELSKCCKENKLNLYKGNCN